MAITPNTTFTAGNVLTAAQMNRLPWGIMQYATKATNFSVTTSEADVGLSVTFTAVANRYYRYTVFIPSADADPSILTLKVTDSSNVSKYRVLEDIDGPAQYTHIILSYVSTESAGSVTRKARALQSTGGGVFQMDSTNVGWMLVEDIGAA